MLLALVGGLSYAEAINLNWASTGGATDPSFYESDAPAGDREDSLTQTETETDYWSPNKVWDRHQDFAQMKNRGYPGVTFFGPRQAAQVQANSDAKSNVQAQAKSGAGVEKFDYEK